MKPALTRRTVITVDMLRGDRTLCQRITGEIHPDLRGYVSGLHGDVSDLHGDVSDLSGYVSDLQGYVSGLQGDVTFLWGDASGLWGDASGLRGDVDDCDISQAERDARIDVKSLILPA